ncbi:MAG: hypothetical protein RLZ95_1683 [Bacteroidota bacterium]
MAINKNHEFEDLDNIKCSIVEKNASTERVQFLKDLLSHNKYQVVVVPSPAPKAAVAPAPAPVAEGEADASEKATNVPPTPEPVTPSTFTVGVTDLRFNPTNAVFGRSLQTTTGQVVTLAYWNQEDTVSDDTVPYFEHNK